MIVNVAKSFNSIYNYPAPGVLQMHARCMIHETPCSLDIQFKIGDDVEERDYIIDVCESWCLHRMIVNYYVDNDNGKDLQKRPNVVGGGIYAFAERYQNDTRHVPERRRRIRPSKLNGLRG